MREKEIKSVILHCYHDNPLYQNYMLLFKLFTSDVESNNTCTHRLPFVLLLTVVLCTATAAADSQRLFITFTAADGLADNSAQTIKCTKTGRMTITTIGNINFYDGAAFRYISSDEEHKYHLEDYRGDYRLNYDAFHHLWLKSPQGVTCVNLTMERFIANMDSLFRTMGMNERVRDLFITSDGDVWFCGAGYIRDTRLQKRFTTDRGRALQDIEVYNRRQLLLFYDDGLLASIDLETGKKQYECRAYDVQATRSYAEASLLLPCGDGLFQIRRGSAGSLLLYFDAPKRTWRTVMTTDGRLNCMALHEGTLYVGASEGYYTCDVETGTTVHERRVRLAGGRELTVDVQAIEFDRQGGMWIGTQARGLLYGRPLNAPFTVLPNDSPEAEEYIRAMADLHGIDEFNGRRANVMLIDSRRWTWVGTSAGLYLYKSPQAEPVLLNRRAGLFSEVIHSMAEDNMGNLWVSSSCGVTCFQIVGDDIRYVTSFDRADNVPNETFLDGKVMKLQNGTIVMQTIDHVLLFNPADFTDMLAQKPQSMNPKLTNLLVNGAFVTVGTAVNGRVILDKAITRMKEINLNYDQNTVALTFSALNFARPLQTYYRVRIRELGDQWQTYSYFNSGGLVDGRGLLHLPMVDLRPGSYHIEIQASNVVDKWEGEPYEWVVNVLEPWWRKSALIGGLMVLVLVLVVVNFVLYNRNTRLRVQRSSNEGDMVRRIQNFAERCEEYNNEPIGIVRSSTNATGTDTEGELNEDFINIMVVILPYVKEQQGKFTIRELLDLTGCDVASFFQIIAANLYKSPRALTRVMRLMQVQEQLRNTNKTVEEISMDCHFESPNCMISSFFHHFRMTPRDYRLTT